MFWASVLFTRMIVTVKTIDKILPDPKPKEHWDFSSVASLIRNLFECYIWYYWLCEDDVLDEVRAARFILLYLHDYGSRRRTFPSEYSEPREADPVYLDLVSQFNGNSILNTVPERKRRELLRGEKTPFIQDEVLERMGWDKDEFRMWYRFYSQHTHTGPMSFYRMPEHDRGSGAETRHEKKYIMFSTALACNVLERAIAGHLKIFPDAEIREPWLTDADVVRNVERAQGRAMGRRRP